MMTGLSRRTLLAVAWVGGPLSAALAQAPAPATPALAAVKAFYDPKVQGDRRPMSKRLSALHAAAVKKSIQEEGPVSGLDFDPAIDGQDSDDDYHKTLKYNVKSADTAKATVDVTFKPFKNRPQVTLVYDLVFEGTWKVNDIAKTGPGAGWRWSALLAKGAKGQ